ncbi:MAG TPA: ABC transporter substrate-binding protein [Rhodospirillaceae bacterium]|nr:ABC transporter substrate-binding protein [Rhodospirillaceae bacterium]MAX62399.1 ABC transporter substrate-binding protein [Rhodospirillaceae bacterium]MBB56212.1 ABC transporter substrate-binding protein [Rhodospirillaceae bacterium]HAE03185.1 ABC transporter substrate-binding protein [Rhodospirillaceae bacterium]HBM13002.1 ABC transporter substrate-binding protein [Rhodospirillaceae bacterium]|tara:strand:+ start:69266 stop:70513 length:1248 start_codon:yes stop_codon:yes gene_type:complete
MLGIGKKALAAAAILSFASPAMAQDSIKMGALATLEGAFTVLGEDGMRGVKMALEEFNYTAGGKKIDLVTGSSDASPDSAVRGARKLVEQDGVQVLVGPLSGSEGLAVKDYAKTHPEVTFLNGSSAAQDTTLRNPADNFFRFSTEGAQWMAGLGEYAYNDKGYRKVAVLAEDYSFPYTQVFGFLEPFCRLGGEAPVDARFWVPIGNKDYSSVIAALPDDVDAIFVALGGADAVNFLTQYEQAGGSAPLIGGSITVDQTVLGSKGRTRDFIIGTPSAGPISDTWDDAGWNEFVAAYKKQFPDGFPSPSLFAHAYYVNTKAALLGLEAVNGDLSDGGAKYRAALADLEFDTPTGKVSLDERRNAIADMFLSEVVEGPDGNLVNKVIKVIPQVSQTLGLSYDEFLKYGQVGRENPTCG